MKPEILLCLALVLSGISLGCSSVTRQDPVATITIAINHEDWGTLRELTKPGMRAVDYVGAWENLAKTGHAVRTGKLVGVDKNSKYYLDDKPCTMYSYKLENKDGTLNPHLLQILVRENGGRSEILDFWIYGW